MEQFWQRRFWLLILPFTAIVFFLLICLRQSHQEEFGHLVFLRKFDLLVELHYFITHVRVSDRETAHRKFNLASKRAGRGFEMHLEILNRNNSKNWGF